MEEILHQLIGMIYKAFYIPGGCLGFLNHQQYNRHITRVFVVIPYKTQPTRMVLITAHDIPPAPQNLDRTPPLPCHWPHAVFQWPGTYSFDLPPTYATVAAIRVWFKGFPMRNVIFLVSILASWGVDPTYSHDRKMLKERAETLKPWLQEKNISPHLAAQQIPLKVFQANSTLVGLTSGRDVQNPCKHCLPNCFFCGLWQSFLQSKALNKLLSLYLWLKSCFKLVKHGFILGKNGGGGAG